MPGCPEDVVELLVIIPDDRGSPSHASRFRFNT
jgi:hypothetical protein